MICEIEWKYQQLSTQIFGSFLNNSKTIYDYRIRDEPYVARRRACLPRYEALKFAGHLNYDEFDSLLKQSANCLFCLSRVLDAKSDFRVFKTTYRPLVKRNNY